VNRRRLLPLVFVLAVGACSSASVPIDDIDPLPVLDPPEFYALLESSERPIVLNVWASWCVPCRSEAALLREAASVNDEILFVGLNVQDSQQGAREFVAEFALTGFNHYFDDDGAVSGVLGSYGVPQTYFYAPGGRLVHRHAGIIDERTLAVYVDDLLRLDV
jgi:cytochrome c biogenesis protein CcmG/thiol:disulfide interchange protein DsbE